MSFQKCNCNSIERNLLTKCNFLVLESSLDLDSGSENEGENDEANTEEIQPSIDRFQPHAMGGKMIEEIVD